jgi:4'-phosphopantetheinyl transferase
MLTSDSIQVWRIRLDFSADSSPTQLLPRLDAWRAMLSAEEQRRAGAFRAEEDRRQYIAAHAALRILLGSVLECAPSSIDFAGEGGSKPSLSSAGLPDPAGPGLRFNLSHTRRAALVALSIDREVGVDIEWERPMEDLYGMARSVMSQEELGRWRGLKPKSQLHAFYEVWTRKESYLKAIGLGLFRDLQEVTVPVSTKMKERQPDGSWRVRDSSGEGDWTVRDVAVWEGYSASVCWAGRIPSRSSHTISISWRWKSDEAR